MKKILISTLLLSLVACAVAAVWIPHKLFDDILAARLRLANFHASEVARSLGYQFSVAEVATIVAYAHATPRSGAYSTSDEAVATVEYTVFVQTVEEIYGVDELTEYARVSWSIHTSAMATALHLLNIKESYSVVWAFWSGIGDGNPFLLTQAEADSAWADFSSGL